MTRSPSKRGAGKGARPRAAARAHAHANASARSDAQKRSLCWPRRGSARPRRVLRREQWAERERIFRERKMDPIPHPRALRRPLDQWAERPLPARGSRAGPGGVGLMERRFGRSARLCTRAINALRPYRRPFGIMMDGVARDQPPTQCCRFGRSARRLCTIGRSARTDGPSVGDGRSGSRPIPHPPKAAAALRADSTAEPVAPRLGHPPIYPRPPGSTVRFAASLRGHLSITTRPSPTPSRLHAMIPTYHTDHPWNPEAT